MSISDDSDTRRRAFFGRRKGHALRPQQAALMETLLPQLALDLARPRRATLRELFPDRRRAASAWRSASAAAST